MADFFNKFKSSVQKNAKVISAKSNSAIERNKLKSELNTLIKTKEEIFNGLGKKVYGAFLAENFSSEMINDEVTSLKELDAKIIAKQEEIEQVKTEEEETINKIKDEAEIAEAQDLEEVEVEVVDTVEEKVEVAQETVEPLDEAVDTVEQVDENKSEQ